MKPLSDLSSQELSLLNSRRRLYCQASEDNSEHHQDGDQAILEFRREIEERYRVSVSNKLYTFPRQFREIREMISSDEDDINPFETEPLKPKMEEYDEFPRNQKAQQLSADFKKKNPHSHRSESNKKKFKLKENSKTRECTQYRLKTEYQNSANLKKAGHKHRHSHLPQEKQATRHKRNVESEFPMKHQRLRTQPDSSSSFMETVRNKFGKKNRNC